MRILIISDVHANLTALEAVLADAGEVEATWCLGDLVGYGPDPNECIARVRRLPNLTCILGNHDAAALNQIDSEAFNQEARLAIEWTQQMLFEGSRSFLGSLPEKVVISREGTDLVTLSHGSPRYPVWEYLLDVRTAVANFDHFSTPYCFVGHTHLPMFYVQVNGSQGARLFAPEPGFMVSLGPRSILNPGSVGQPRDRDARAAYAIFESDTNTWCYHRVAYDIQSVQSRMIAVGLPRRHIERLAGGW